MFEAITNLVLFFLCITLFVVCVLAIADSDGNCHMESCEGCFYVDWCENHAAKENRDKNDNGRKMGDGL